MDTTPKKSAADGVKDAPLDLAPPAVHIDPPSAEAVPAAEVAPAEVVTKAEAIEHALAVEKFVTKTTSPGAVCPIGTVSPGDVGGLASTVVRLIGQGDGGVYDGPAVDEIKFRQSMAGMENTGIVSGKTWSLILPVISMGAQGEVRAILMRLLGRRATGQFDPTLADQIVDLQIDKGIVPTGTTTAETWAALIEGA